MLHLVGTISKETYEFTFRGKAALLSMQGSTFEDEDAPLLRNFGIRLPSDATSYPGKKKA